MGWSHRRGTRPRRARDMYFAQDNLLFFPQPLAGAAGERVARPVEGLAVEREAGVTVRGWLVKGAKPPARRSSSTMGGTPRSCRGR